MEATQADGCCARKKRTKFDQTHDSKGESWNATTLRDFWQSQIEYQHAWRWIWIAASSFHDLSFSLKYTSVVSFSFSAESDRRGPQILRTKTREKRSLCTLLDLWECIEMCLNYLKLLLNRPCFNFCADVSARKIGSSSAMSSIKEACNARCRQDQCLSEFFLGCITKTLKNRESLRNVKSAWRLNSQMPTCANITFAPERWT